MPQKLKKKISDELLHGESDLESNNGNDSSESTLPTDPTIPGLAGLSLLDVRIFLFFIVIFFDKSYNIFENLSILCELISIRKNDMVRL